VSKPRKIGIENRLSPGEGRLVAETNVQNKGNACLLGKLKTAERADLYSGKGRGENILKEKPYLDSHIEIPGGNLRTSAR